MRDKAHTWPRHTSRSSRPEESSSSSPAAASPGSAPLLLLLETPSAHHETQKISRKSLTMVEPPCYEPKGIQKRS